MSSWTKRLNGFFACPCRTIPPSMQDTSRQPRAVNHVRKTPNFRLVWLNNNTEEKHAQEINSRLQEKFQNIKVFTESEQCIDFLTKTPDGPTTILITGDIKEDLVRRVHQCSQLKSIYLLTMGNEEWPSDLFKLKSIKDISEIVVNSVGGRWKRGDEQIPMSVLRGSPGQPEEELAKLNYSFMYTLILKDILLKMRFDSTDFKKFISYCRKVYGKAEKVTIDQFEKDYRGTEAVQWYSKETFLYGMINNALRDMNFNLIIKMGFFLRDLHRQINLLQLEQYRSGKFIQTPLYRGQRLSKVEFEQSRQVNGLVVSFNAFLSTSEDEEVALGFISNPTEDPDFVYVLFVIQIDLEIASSRFARIGHLSAIASENEVLFSMHSVFRVEKIQPFSKDNRIWQIDLVQADEFDHDLRELTKFTRNETEGLSPEDRLGRFLIKVGKPKEAEQVYKTLLEKTSDEEEKAHMYNQLGWTQENQHQYKEAGLSFRTSADILERFLPERSLDLASAYNNLGTLFDRQSDYEEALKYYQKAFDIRKAILKPDALDLADSYNNFGLLHMHKGEYPEALTFHQKALKIRLKHLPENHPDLAQSYNNLHLIQKRTDQESEAQTSLEKAMSIQQRALPSEHPNRKTAAAYRRLQTSKTESS